MCNLFGHRQQLQWIATAILIFSHQPRLRAADPPPRFASETSFEKLDEILQKAGSVQKFLASPALQTEYFNYLHPMVSVTTALHRDAFDGVLQQLSKVLKTDPSLAKRLWETEGLGAPLSIQSEGRNFGRDLNEKAWQTHYQQTLGRLKSDGGPVKNRSQAYDILEEAAQGFDIGFGEADTQKGRVAIAKRLEALKKTARFTQAAAFIVAEELQQSVPKNPKGADELLNILETLKKNPEELVRDRGGSVLSSNLVIRNLLRERVPSTSSLLANQTMFPPSKRATMRGKTINVQTAAPFSKYELRPPPRRFHGIMKGYFGGRECIGGTMCMYTVPARWGNIAMEDSKLWFVYRDGLPTGYVQAVPVESTSPKGTYATLDLKSDDLFNPFISKTKEGEVVNETVLGPVLRHLQNSKPKTWKGFVLGHTGSISATSSHHENPAYYLGDHFSKDFNWTDPKTVQALEVNSLPNQYFRGGIVTDATVYDQSYLRVLATPEQIATRLQDPEMVELRKKIAFAHDNKEVREIFRNIAKRKTGDKILATYLASEESPQFWSETLDALSKRPIGPEAQHLITSLYQNKKAPGSVMDDFKTLMKEKDFLPKFNVQELIEKVGNPKVSENERTSAALELSQQNDLSKADIQNLEKIFYSGDEQTKVSLWETIRKHPETDHLRFADHAYSWIDSKSPRADFYGTGYFRNLPSTTRTNGNRSLNNGSKIPKGARV